jgi:hypothetical protein
MENYQSITEGEWLKIEKIVLTETEMELLKSTKEEDKDAKTELLKSKKPIKTILTANESEEFVTLYNNIKPKLKDGDSYQLISIDVVKTNALSGILNCRVNNNHEQIRF